jgi:hypothetical protein
MFSCRIGGGLPAQAATIAQVHRNTIYNWVASNKVEWCRTPSGQLRIFIDTLLRRQKWVR